jgi:hypothetical protein
MRGMVDGCFASTAHAHGAHVTVDAVVAAVLAIGAEGALAAPVSGTRRIRSRGEALRHDNARREPAAFRPFDCPVGRGSRMREEVSGCSKNHSNESGKSGD